MRYLVFDSQALAQAAVEHINERARTVYAAQGYTLTPSGAVVGKAAGKDNPEGITTTWDVPRQRLDGKWLVLHPENHPSAAFPVLEGTLVEYLLALFPEDGLPINPQEEAAEWWPAPAWQA